MRSGTRGPRRLGAAVLLVAMAACLSTPPPSDPPADAGPGPGAADAAAEPAADAAAGDPTCDASFGHLAGYALCAERPAECEFNVEFGRLTSCNAVCDSVGVACLATFANESADDRCASIGTLSCSSVGNSDNICVCERP